MTISMTAIAETKLSKNLILFLSATYLPINKMYLNENYVVHKTIRRMEIKCIADSQASYVITEYSQKGF